MSLCLNMIVKNESHIIEETLENICHNFPITYWVISDTGSTDNTIAIIESFFQNKGIEGQIHQEPWKNFSHNRNEALKQCEGKADYVLIFDADDYVKGNLKLPKLTHDTYMMQFTNESGNTRYLRKLIIKNDGSYKWHGVLHEFLKSERQDTIGEIRGDYVIVSGRKGDRSRNKNKYKDDAKILKEAFLAGEDTDLLPRYAFYCAQSFRDAKMIDDAIEWYTKRVNITEGWADEIYCSYKELGLLYEKKDNFKEALYYWEQGIIHDPKRAECWYHCARRHSWNKNAELAYSFAKMASEIKLPTGNRLFVTKNIYLYWSYYELCLNAFRLGKLSESYEAFKKLVIHCPQDLVDRLARQMPSYKKFIFNDSPEEIEKLSKNLKRLDRINILRKVMFS